MSSVGLAYKFAQTVYDPENDDWDTVTLLLMNDHSVQWAYEWENL